MLYNISFLDRTVWVENKEAPPVRRSIIYKANIAEVITAYGDPGMSGTVRNYLDICEYTTRDYSFPLVYGIDIPNYAQVFDYNFTQADGTPLNLPSRVGIYEKDAGMLWRHSDYTLYRGRSGRELVLTHINVIANYDYTFNWIFTQCGEIRLEIIPSGVIETDSIPLTKLPDEASLAKPKHGGNTHPEETNEQINLVYPNINGLNHSHYACVRIDFAIDGHNNSVEESNLGLAPVSETNPYGNVFGEEGTLLQTEKQSMRDNDLTKSRTWRVFNPNSKNIVGHQRSYEINTHPNSTLMNPDTRIAKRATYMLHNLHVTKYHDDELYAMGKFPTEGSEDEGLKKYIEDDESIVNTDIVTWITFGFSHHPRPEDYPVMPKEPLSISFKPEGFFNENPGLYIQPTELSL